MILRGLTLAIVSCLALPAIVVAQNGDTVVPVPPSSYGRESAEEVPADQRPPPQLEAPESRWPEPSSSLALGIPDPIRGTEPDDGLVLSGFGLFLGAYLSGLALTSPFAALGPGDETFALFGFVPFAQWAVGFYGGNAALAAIIFIGGGVFAFWQVLGAFLMLGGLAHQRDLIRPRPEAGGVALTPNGVQVAF